MNVMKSTFRVLFYLQKNEVNKLGNLSIMVRITVNGEKVQFSSKLQIKPELWDTKNAKALGRNSDAMNINRLLNAISVKANGLYHKLELLTIFGQKVKRHYSYLVFCIRY